VECPSLTPAGPPRAVDVSHVDARSVAEKARGSYFAAGDSYPSSGPFTAEDPPRPRFVGEMKPRWRACMTQRAAVE
jgi:hypothetical protein